MGTQDWRQQLAAFGAQLAADDHDQGDQADQAEKRRWLSQRIVIQYRCPVCGAVPGVRCTRPDNDWPRKTLHAERQAYAWAEGARPPR